MYFDFLHRDMGFWGGLDIKTNENPKKKYIISQLHYIILFDTYLRL